MELYAPLTKMDPALAEHFKTLRAVAPDAANAVAHRMMTDHMIPGIGNKLAYDDFLTRPREGVHVILDGNDFGSINKRFGQKTGDDAIRAMGSAIAVARKQFRGKMFRVGGDEFRLHFDKPEQAMGFTRAMRSHLEALPPVQGVHFHSVSVGMGPTPDHADQALIHAKNAKKATGAAPGHAQTHVHSLMPGQEGAVAGPAPKGVAQPVKKSINPADEMKAKLQMREELAKMALIHDNPRRPVHVYRIENEHGDGPYTGGVAGGLPDYDRVQAAPHAPSPRIDFTPDDRVDSGLDRYPPTPRFGFLTPHDAENWWGHENLSALRERGFYLRKVPAAKVWLSNTKKQVMFHPAPAKATRQATRDGTPGAQRTLVNEDGQVPKGIVPPKKVY